MSSFRNKAHAYMQGQDIALLLQLSIHHEPKLPSKDLAAMLAISPSEISKALRRCAAAGLLYVADGEKRVNRSALMEFLAHGLRYVYPPQRGGDGAGCPDCPCRGTLEVSIP